MGGKGEGKTGTITGGQNKEDQILLAKIGKYIDFCVYRRSYLLWPPVLIAPNCDPSLSPVTGVPAYLPPPPGVSLPYDHAWIQKVVNGKSLVTQIEPESNSGGRRGVKI